MAALFQWFGMRFGDIEVSRLFALFRQSLLLQALRRTARFSAHDALAGRRAIDGDGADFMLYMILPRWTRRMPFRRRASTLAFFREAH